MTQKESNDKIRAAKRAIITLAKDRPCADCGGRFPVAVMDLDHVRGVKSFDIGASTGSVSYERLINEIAKCDVVCYLMK